MNTQEKIGAKLKELRLRKGVTQQEVADRIGGLTRNYISQMESGKRKISIEFLQKMADLFNVDITYFFEEGNQVSLSEEEKAWVLDLRELERQGVSAEDVRKWVKMAREIRDK
ncbi:helix-turn-helix domain-containing protein [Shouchella miscanthi]|uniref:helix-turn-helix domain-containing protein n=1 Tax=Shouchella miscanthi TaxID=2598861 RepID=UPI001643E342|nr:helix-turn-helix transcriptional regulator [Shouchella miscanthi]